MRVHQCMPCAIVASLLAFSILERPAHGGDDPFADEVIDYEPGVGGNPSFQDPLTALGSPERFTGEGVFPGAVTPFNAAFGTDEIVTLGSGGRLVVKFNTPVRDDPANPFGIDLIVFGNAFFFDADFPQGVVGGLGSEGGVIEVSADGADWRVIDGVDADGLFPTLGYLDLEGPYDENPGTIDSDFQLPMDPSLALADVMGLAWPELLEVYGRSGGGAGIDLAATGLSEISFVRIANPENSGVTPEIDAFVDAKHPADFNHDGTVGPADLAQLLDAWGPAGPKGHPADLNGDGFVGPPDLAILLDAWTSGRP